MVLYEVKLLVISLILSKPAFKLSENESRIAFSLWLLSGVLHSILFAAHVLRVLSTLAGEKTTNGQANVGSRGCFANSFLVVLGLASSSFLIYMHRSVLSQRLKGTPLQISGPHSLCNSFFTSILPHKF